VSETFVFWHVPKTLGRPFSETAVGSVKNGPFFWLVSHRERITRTVEHW
jgi:hypothetical protein